MKNYGYNDKDSTFTSKQKEIFNKVTEKRLQEKTKLDKEINYDNLKYKYTGLTAVPKLNEFENTFNLVDITKEAEISLGDRKTEVTL